MFDVGDVVVCSRGHLGMITSDEKTLVKYADGTKAYAWTGILLENLFDKPAGSLWCSRNPTLVMAAKSFVFLMEEKQRA